MDLSAYSEGALRGVADRLRSRYARDPVAAHVARPVDVLAGTPLAVARAVVETALAERARRCPSPELVWTGPAPVERARHRDTALVLRGLFASARSRVVLAGYRFDHGRRLLEPLHAAMRDRGVTVRMFVHVPVEQDVMRAPPAQQVAHCHGEVAKLLAANWPFGAPYPEVFYETRPMDTGRFSSMHAKCVVVDARVALVTSANFTRRAQQDNVEVGALIHDPGFVAALAAQWANAVSHGLFVPYQPTTSAKGA